MGKKFNILTTVSSSEVSLCSKYNSGANKQTEFELVKDKENKTLDIKPVIKSLLECEPEEWTNGFKEFLEYWLEYDVNNCFYGLLNQGLQESLCNIQYNDELTKEEKTLEYIKLFNEFVEMYNTLPITKTQEGKYEVSLVSKSHIQEQDTIPQNETNYITKENTSKMEKQNMFEQAIDLLKNAFSFEKTETPAEQPVVEEAPVEEVAVEAVETVEETIEAPVEETVEEEVVEKTVEENPVEEKVAEPAEVEEAPVEEPAEEVEEKVEEAKEEIEAPVEEIEKTETVEPSELEIAIQKSVDLQKELEEIKKAKEESEIKLEKMSFVQKAKDEFSMLSGTPEEIGEQLYSIAKSNLDEVSKTFILENLKKVSSANKELTQEIGSMTKNAGDMTEEEMQYVKAHEIAKTKGISVKKALRELK